MDINIVMNKLNIKYYESIIISLEKQNNNNSQSYIVWLQEKMAKLSNNISTVTESEPVQSVQSVQHNNTTDNHMELYKKPWNKLNQVHKILKIKEFINSLTNIDVNEKDKLKDKLIELIKNKVLSKKEKINYDENNGKIISLLNLEYKNNKYIYNIE
jgi:hypothetical protein